ncbi:unnamed protein product [Euphydryas editha]|uniref:Hornerin n=1 Tax=Euphydryas editha TaxID=104508 RepID=A0AAU9UX95_EUPED|nr:unnamed protein product [Euphydryas editha]
MELLCVFALALVTSVTGIPHAYGVKSGAVAKAEANAAAGVFGGLPVIPLSIPSGGFSGSFSKSSSSSFASSSASASSSSSSYSFSGSNGIAGFGCQYNNCKNSGNSVPSTLHNSQGNGIQNNGEASAGTGNTAGSSIYSGNGENAPCTGSNCNGLSISTNKCSSGKCGLPGNPQDTSTTSNNNNVVSNCASGQCNAEPQNGNSLNSYDSSKCASGNCSPTGPQHKDTASNLNDYNLDSAAKSNYEVKGDEPNLNSNDKKGQARPSSDEQDIFIPLSPSANGARPVSKPATQLSVPYLDPTCTSHNCNIAPSDHDSSKGKLPTSYNVPILGPSSTVSYPDSSSNPTGTAANSLSNCGSASCPSDVLSSTNTASVSSQPSTYTQASYPSQILVAPVVSPSCSGYNCKPEQQKPNSDVPIYQVSSKQPIACNAPDCSFSPATDSSVVGYPSQFDSSKPYVGASSQSEQKKYTDYAVKPNLVPSATQQHLDNNGYTTNTGSFNVGSQQGSFDTKLYDNSKTGFVSTRQNLPSFTGGFTKPTGSIDGNVGYTPSHGSTGSSKPQFYVSSPTYTGGFSKPTASINGNIGYTPLHGSTGSFKPQFDISSPTNTGGFTKPTEPIDENVGYTPSHPSTGSSKPQFDVSSPTYTGGFRSSKPQFDVSSLTYTGGFSKPTGSINGNVGYTPSHSSIGTSKPHLYVSSTTQSTPVYTGGFGGSAGSFDTSSGIGTHFSSKPSHGYAPTSNNLSNSNNIGDLSGSGVSKTSSSPVLPIHNVPTSAGNFAESHRPTSVLQAGIPSLSKPVVKKDELPVYTGGFGGPKGLLKPNEYNLPAKLPAAASNNYGPTSCTSANCNVINVPKTIGAYQGTGGAPTSLSASADAKAVAYTGGFGGPSGFLKPLDNDRQSKSEHFGVEGQEKFNNHGHTNDGIDSKNKYSSGSKDKINSGVDGTGAQTNAGAQANAAAFASSGAFSANQGTGETGCNSDCGANYSSGLGHNIASSNSLGSSHIQHTDSLENTVGVAAAEASAKSIAGASARSFGVGNSFASSSASAHSSAGASVKGGK